MPTTQRSRRVLIAGGGVAALEAALALRALAGDRVDVTLLAPDRTFAYRPFASTEPFGGPAVIRFPLAAIAADRGFSLLRDAVAEVDPAAHRVRTQGGATLAYDWLVLALGATPIEAVPGALTLRARDVDRMRAIVDAARAGAVRSLVFAAPPGTAWTLPLYELALGTAASLAGMDAPPALCVVTPERLPLEAFGPDAAAAVAALLRRRGIALRPRSMADAARAGRLWMAGGGALPADRVVALPRLAGRRVPGIPCDHDGFVAVDLLGRVDGLQGVFAAGDGTRGPVEQRGPAGRQAAAAAAAIAEQAGVAAAPEPHDRVLRAVLATGDGALYLRHPAAPGEPGVATDPPWWPPGKLVARHLAPYLATHPELAERAAHAPRGLVA